jgi:hypothetical protein
MLDEELATAVEQLGKRHLSVGAVEDGLLTLTRVARRSAQLTAIASALFREKLLPRLEPLLPRYGGFSCTSPLLHRLPQGLTPRRKILPSHGWHIAGTHFDTAGKKVRTSNSAASRVSAGPPQTRPLLRWLPIWGHVKLTAPRAVADYF